MYLSSADSSEGGSYDQEMEEKKKDGRFLIV